MIVTKSNAFDFHKETLFVKKVFVCALLFLTILLTFGELYPRKSQKIDLSTGAGISKMLRYDDAQVYLFGETHRCTEYQQFRNVLFKYLVKEKGVRVLVEEAGYATTFLQNETVQGRLSFSDWLDRCTSSKEDYELYQWIADWNSGREDADKISIIGIDITDNIGNMQMLCQYLLKTCNFTGADVQTQRLLTAIRKQNPFSSLQLQTFQDEFLPQLIELYQTKPEQLENVLGTQAMHLERALLGWQEALEQQRLRGKAEQLGDSDDVYRENCLYENFMREYQERPDTKYYGEFGAAHVLMSDYSGKIYRVQNSFVTRLAEEGSPLNGKLTVIDGGLTFEIGDLGESDTNKVTLYNTASAKPPVQDMNKFYMDGFAQDASYAQYVLLYEHPNNLTAAKEYSGSYWKHH
jgi:hypothetical protein